MKVAIIGSGFTGLSLGYYLGKSGHQVTVFEKSSHLGGLAAGFKIGDWYVDRFYHHIFSSDKEILELAKEIGFSSWIWKEKQTTSTYYDHKLFPFTTPLDLLNFKAIPFTARLRTGIASVLLKIKTDESGLEQKLAYRWIKQLMGEKSYRVIWRPLLKKKFTKKYYQKIIAGWLWARIKKRTFKLGYPVGGFEALAGYIAQAIKANRGQVLLEKEIKDIGKLLKVYDRVIYTGPTVSLPLICPQLPASYQNKCRQKISLTAFALIIEYNGTILPDHYWININTDQPANLVCVVNHSSFVPKKYTNHKQVIYLAGYFDPNDPFLRKNKTNILKKWLPLLSKLDSGFHPKNISKTHLFKAANAQPVMLIGYRNQILTLQTPIKNLYLLNMDQIYPYDRGVNYSVQLAKTFITKHNI